MSWCIGAANPIFEGFVKSSQALKDNLFDDKRNFGIVNICSGKPIYLKSLVKKWIKELDSKITIDHNFYPYNDYEAMEFWGSNNKLKKAIRSLKIKKNI